jgi:hypothetical protein
MAVRNDPIAEAYSARPYDYSIPATASLLSCSALSFASGPSTSPADMEWS